jgi:integrase
MAYIHKRLGKKGASWQVRWQAPDGTWLAETFGSAREAKEKKAAIETGASGGKNSTLAVLCDECLAHYRVMQDGGIRERSTVEQIRQHIAHIKADDVSETRLHNLKTPDIQAFLDRLIAGGMSRTTASKVRTSLRSIIKFGMQRGAIPIDPVSASKIDKRIRDEVEEDGPVVIPPQEALRRLLEAADARATNDEGYAAAAVRLLLFCGLRMSELRGLSRRAIIATGDAPHIKVIQRADKWQQLGAPKSKGSRRRIPLGADTAKALRTWLLVAPAGDLGLAFPNGAGNVESYANLWNRFWTPLCAEAGLADAVTRVRKQRKTGKPTPVAGWKPHYSPHVLRHAYASILIANRNTPKKVSELMGHGSIQITMDTYGHLWPNDAEDAGIAAAAETLILKPAS